MGTGLFARTVSNLRSTELGFNRDGLLLATIATARARYTDDALKDFYGNLRSPLEQLPGVEDVSLSWSVLAGGGTYVRPVSIPGPTFVNRRSMCKSSASRFSDDADSHSRGSRDSDQEVTARRAVTVVDRRFAETTFPALIRWDG